VVKIVIQMKNLPKKTKISIITWFFIFASIITCQAQDDVDTQIWTDIVPSKLISDFVTFAGDVGARWSVKRLGSNSYSTND